MADANGHETAQEMKMRLREKPLSELMEELEQMSSISEYDCDIDLICAYLDVLEEKAPVLPKGYDPAAEYEKFKENHSELFDVPAAPLPEKAPASGVMELEVAEENGFKSLAEALEYYEVENPAIPSWIPSRYSIDRVTVFSSNDTVVISGRYTNNDNMLFIRVTLGFDEAFTFEEDQTDEHDVYRANGIEFVLSTNMDTERATWSMNETMYSTGGNVTIDELEEMLGSIRVEE